MGDDLWKIDREIEAVSGMWASPYRKGIVAGLIERKGGGYPACPYASGSRAERNWMDGLKQGLTRNLTRWDDPA